MRHLFAILLSVSLAIGPQMALAQGDELAPEQEERLVTLIDDGKEAYDAGQFEISLEKFRQAYDIYPHPDIVYRLALCYERLGEDEQAVEQYRKFLREAPDAPERARIEKTIEVIEARISKSEIRITTVPEGAIVYIDDVANGAAGYTPTALAVKPGNYTLIVQKEGFEPVRELVAVKGGQSVNVRYQLSEEGTEPTADGQVRDATKKPRSGPSVKLLTLLSIGVASAVVSVVFFGLHGDKRSELEELDALPRQEIPRTRYDTVKRQTNINLAVAISTAALSVFSFVWAYGVWQADLSAKNALLEPPSSGPVIGWSDGGFSDGRPTLGYEWRF